MLTAAASPAVVIGGWTYAARDIDDFDSFRNTISALAVPGAPHRRVATAALAVLGGCYVGTAVALDDVPLPGRLLLGLGGALTAVVAGYAQPAPGEADVPEHTWFAGAAFASLAFWPLLGMRRDVPVLSPAVATTAVAVMTAQAAAFVALIGKPERYEGLVERVLAATQASWPLVVALAVTKK